MTLTIHRDTMIPTPVTLIFTCPNSGNLISISSDSIRMIYHGRESNNGGLRAGIEVECTCKRRWHIFEIYGN